MNRLKMIYVAGKFSAKTREGVEENIKAAVAVGLEVARVGGFPVIPHANTAYPDFEKLQPYPFWIQGTMQQLEACDAVIMVPGWSTSSGAKGEKARAEELDMPVFYYVEDLEEWLRAEEASVRFLRSALGAE